MASPNPDLDLIFVWRVWWERNIYEKDADEKDKGLPWERLSRGREIEKESKSKEDEGREKEIKTNNT